MMSPERREARKSARRSTIVEVAGRHFLSRGYDRTSMSRIVAEMGGSKGTLWSHFASKEALFAAVIDEATDSFRLEMAAILDPTRDIDEALARFATQFVLRLTAPDAVALQRLIAGEVERFPEIGRIFYDRAPRMSRDLLSAYLADRMASGHLRADDPLEAADMLLNLCCGHYHLGILLGLTSPDPVLALREAALAVRQFRSRYARTS